MKHADMQCDHSNSLYESHILVCSDCGKSGLEGYLMNKDYPASFTEIFVDSDTGYNIVKINNHIDKVTFFKSYDRNAEYIGTFRNLSEALSAGSPSINPIGK